ncbi:hypothetical protein NUBL13784_36200 [Klebsiella pneumoniae]|jgi:hypothetical protein|nr:hypothetical protein NUBL13784_36200 [Klebsiella pneumoniae]DAV41207.1 MAG TPA: hypothetical protein [Caudoviricetes sp.]
MLYLYEDELLINGGKMNVFLKKESNSLTSTVKMLIVAIVTYQIGIGWGLICIATINVLPSITIKFN